MSRLLEILGAAVKFDTCRLIWNWLDIILSKQAGQNRQTVSDSHLLREIIKLVEHKKTDSAVKKLLSYLNENPACSAGRLAAAAIYISQGKLDRAVEELNEIYRRQPNNTMALYALGHTSELKGNEPQAVAFYQDCIKFKSYLQLPRQRLAAIYFKNGRLEKAIEEYEALRRENPADISFLTTLGYLYIEAVKFSDAVDAFNTAILIHPDNFDDSDSLTEELIAEGKLEDAAQRLEGLIAEEPGRADLLVRYGDVLSILGGGAEAVSQYEKAIEIRPDFLEATIKLGTELMGIGETCLAAVQFNKAFEINEQIIDAYIGLATAQNKAGSLTAAMETLALACSLEPNSTLLFTQTAALGLQSKLEYKISFSENTGVNLLEEVIKAHKLQLKHQENNPDLLFRLGILMCAADRRVEAVDLFKTAIQINPLYSRAANKLLLSLLELQQQKAAAEILSQHNLFDKKTLDLHYRTALLYCDKIKFASSMLDFENKLELNMASCSDNSFNVSIILQNLGLLDRTETMWENLSETNQMVLN